jgi:hypothetical protein
VGGISERKVAERAGVDLDYVTRLVDTRVLAPAGDGTFTEDDARRARLSSPALSRPRRSIVRIAS